MSLDRGVGRHLPLHHLLHLRWMDSDSHKRVTHSFQKQSLLNQFLIRAQTFNAQHGALKGALALPPGGPRGTVTLGDSISIIHRLPYTAPGAGTAELAFHSRYPMEKVTHDEGLQFSYFAWMPLCAYCHLSIKAKVSLCLIHPVNVRSQPQSFLSKTPRATESCDKGRVFLIK